jgi:Ca-activated chloride channel family protein
MNIASPQWAWLALVLPVLVFLQWLARHKSQQALAQYSSPKLLPKLLNNYAMGRRWLSHFLLISALVFIILASIRPQWGQKEQSIKREGLDILLLQDVSLSMLAEDIKPSRLIRSRHEISDFIEQLSGDRVGLVAFSGEARTLCPLTYDYSTIHLFLNELSPKLLLPGTNIAAALKEAQNAFKRSNSQSRYQIVVLLSDGEEHEEEAITIAQEMARQGITLYTIGIGSPAGVPIPIKTQQGSEYKKDLSGNIVTTRLNVNLLEKIAQTGKGQFYHAGPGDFELRRILNDIADRERIEMEEQEMQLYQERFQIPLLIALLLLSLEALLSFTIRRTAKAGRTPEKEN